MKTTNKALNIKGITTPDYNEPKGEAYFKLVQTGFNHISKLRAEQSEANQNISDLETEIRAIEIEIAGKVNRSDKYELKKTKRELEKKMKPFEPVAYKDIQSDIDEVLNDPKLTKLQAESLKEYSKIYKQAKAYGKELDEAYRVNKKDLNRFLADYGSDSFYRMANSRNNSMKN